MYKKVAVIGLSMIICAAMVGCGGNDKPPGIKRMPPKLELTIGNKLEANVYLDSTYSMRGYVQPEGSTLFIEAVKGIETIISGTWKNEKVSFHKFGFEDDRIEKLTRDQFLASNNINFYNTTKTNEEMVVSKFDMDKLNIMVTDLFQTDQHLESLTIALKRKCFTNEDNALAIIGLKSQFDGTIYDIGRDLKKVDHKSVNNREETFRPFYLLVAGKAEDVRAFSVKYKNKFPNAKIAMYTHQLGMPNILDYAEVNQELKKKAGKARLMRPLEDKKDGAPSLQYQIEKDGTLGRTDLRLYCGYSFNKYRNFISKSQKDSFVKASVVNIKEDNANIIFDIDFTVDPRGIEYRKGFYEESFNLLVDKDEYINEQEAVFADWNIEENAAIQNLKSVGNKTLNIKKLTKDLAIYSYEFHKPGIYGMKVNIQAK